MQKRTKLNRQLNNILSQACVLQKVQIGSEELLDRAIQTRQHLTTLRKHHGIHKRDKRLKRPRKTVKDKILAMSQQVITKSDLNNGSKKVLENTIESSSKENSSLLAHRFAGKTMFLLDDNKLGIRLETFFGGKYQETYYVFLSYDKQNSKICIYRHTIPIFVPLHTIVDKYLNKNIRRFIDVLADYLNAYVDRRGQILQFQNDIEDVTTKSNEAFDFCHITYELEGRSHVFILNYELDKSLPTKVVVKATENDRRKHKKKFEDLFKKMEILDAFRSCFQAPKSIK